MTTLLRTESRSALMGALSVLALSMSTFAQAEVAYKIAEIASPAPQTILSINDLNNKGEVVGSLE